MAGGSLLSQSERVAGGTVRWHSARPGGAGESSVLTPLFIFSPWSKGSWFSLIESARLPTQIATLLNRDCRFQPRSRTGGADSTGFILHLPLLPTGRHQRLKLNRYSLLFQQERSLQRIGFLGQLGRPIQKEKAARRFPVRKGIPRGWDFSFHIEKLDRTDDSSRASLMKEGWYFARNGYSFGSLINAASLFRIYWKNGGAGAMMQLNGDRFTHAGWAGLLLLSQKIGFFSGTCAIKGSTGRFQPLPGTFPGSRVEIWLEAAFKPDAPVELAFFWAKAIELNSRQLMLYHPVKDRLRFSFRYTHAAFDLDAALKMASEIDGEGNRELEGTLRYESSLLLSSRDRDQTQFPRINPARSPVLYGECRLLTSLDHRGSVKGSFRPGLRFQYQTVRISASGGFGFRLNRERSSSRYWPDLNLSMFFPVRGKRIRLRIGWNGSSQKAESGEDESLWQNAHISMRYYR